VKLLFADFETNQPLDPFSDAGFAFVTKSLGKSFNFENYLILQVK